MADRHFYADGLLLYFSNIIEVFLVRKLYTLYRSRSGRIASIHGPGFSPFPDLPLARISCTALVGRAFVIEGFAPYGRSASNARTRLMLRAVQSGLPVVRVGRGNTSGFVPLDKPAFIGGSNLTATRARLLLMACLMRFGALPPAANPDQPTAEETATTHEKVAAYQTIFNTH